MVTLNFHRRHSENCEGKHPAKSYSSESDEKKKDWGKRCKCPIYASGSLNRVAKRMATKQSDWAQAAILMAPYIAANSWDITPVPPPPTAPTTPAPAPVTDAGSTEKSGGVTVPSAIKAYLAAHVKVRSAHGTIRAKRYLLTRLEDFSVLRQLVHVTEWTTPLVREFSYSWEVAASTSNKNLASVKAFFEFCRTNQWIKVNPARYKDITNRSTREATNPRQHIPYTDAELERMYEACRDLGRTEIRTWPKKKDGRQVEALTPYRDYARKKTGEDLIDFITLSVWTGLRISDVATFNIERLQPNGEVHVRTIKNVAKVYTWVPEWLAKRLRERAKLNGPVIFGPHTAKNVDSITDLWRDKLIKIWDLAGPWAPKAEHHRFRHTFARVLLQHGVPVVKVAELMGDTVETILKYYGTWVPERQEALTTVLRGAFAGVPNPHAPRKAKVLAMKRG
jgi:integrase